MPVRGVVVNPAPALSSACSVRRIEAVPYRSPPTRGVPPPPRRACPEKGLPGEDRTSRAGRWPGTFRPAPVWRGPCLACRAWRVETCPVPLPQVDPAVIAALPCPTLCPARRLRAVGSECPKGGGCVARSGRRVQRSNPAAPEPEEDQPCRLEKCGPRFSPSSFFSCSCFHFRLLLRT